MGIKNQSQNTNNAFHMLHSQIRFYLIYLKTTNFQPMFDSTFHHGKAFKE